MAKRKKKTIFNQEIHDMKKRIGRFPVARPTEFHEDKSKYNRRVKHKEMTNDNYR